MASIKSDGKVIDYTPVSAVSAGDVLVIGSLIGVAVSKAAAGQPVGVDISSVVELPCATGATGAQGSAINWVAASGVADAATGVAAGKLAKARAAGDSTVHVVLNK